MSFATLKQNLEAEGWFVGWKLSCCSSCAWWDVPDEADLSKVLFNHEQDCEVDESEECTYCKGDGYVMECHDSDGEETEEECMNCQGQGYFMEYYEHGDDTEGSHFCFDGSKKGVENLKAILPIIEDSGCAWTWNETGKTRIWIEWK